MEVQTEVAHFRSHFESMKDECFLGIEAKSKLIKLERDGFITAQQAIQFRQKATEFYTSYIALLSLIQWIAVAALGLVLTGAAALIAHFAPQPAIEQKKYRRKYVH